MSEIVWLVISLLIGIVMLGLLLWLVITALLQISRDTSLSSTATALWCLVVVVSPFLGALLWFWIGAKNSRPFTPMK